MSDKTRTALILIDWINDIIHPDGKLAGHGYPEFMSRHETVRRVAAISAHARSRDWLVVHVRVAFSPGYQDHPARSPLMGPAKAYGALRDGDWGTQFHDDFLPQGDEPVVTKRRINAFFGTELDLLLRTNGIGRIAIAGVATDLAVQSTARDAHDRDYETLVIGDACAAAQDDEHVSALAALQKIATVVAAETLLTNVS